MYHMSTNRTPIHPDHILWAVTVFAVACFVAIMTLRFVAPAAAIAVTLPITATTMAGLYTFFIVGIVRSGKR